MNHAVRYKYKYILLVLSNKYSKYNSDLLITDYKIFYLILENIKNKKMRI